MKLLLDQNLNGMKMFLESFEYEVETASDKKMSQVKDYVLVKEALNNEFIFITQNNDAADLARMHKTPLVHINMAFPAQAVHNELQRKGELR